MKLVSFLARARETAAKQFLAASVAVAVPVMSWAQQQGGLDAYNQARQQAGNRTIETVATNADRTTNTFLNTALLLFGAVGIGLVGLSLWGMYKASKDERETPKSAIVGLFIGGAMTAVVLITAFVTNTLTL